VVGQEAAVKSLDVQSPHRSHQNIGRQCGENLKDRIWLFSMVSRFGQVKSNDTMIVEMILAEWKRMSIFEEHLRIDRAKYSNIHG